MGSMGGFPLAGLPLAAIHNGASLRQLRIPLKPIGLWGWVDTASEFSGFLEGICAEALCLA